LRLLRVCACRVGEVYDVWSFSKELRNGELYAIVSVVVFELRSNTRTIVSRKVQPIVKALFKEVLLPKKQLHVALRALLREKVLLIHYRVGVYDILQWDVIRCATSDKGVGSLFDGRLSGGNNLSPMPILQLLEAYQYMRGKFRMWGKDLLCLEAGLSLVIAENYLSWNRFSPFVF